MFDFNYIILILLSLILIIFILVLLKRFFSKSQNTNSIDILNNQHLTQSLSKDSNNQQINSNQKDTESTKQPIEYNPEHDKLKKQIINSINEMHPNMNTQVPCIICILKWGLGNRIKCLISSIILSKYLNRQLYVIWTDFDMKNTDITDIWKKPYPFIVLPKIPDNFELPISPENEWEDSSITCWKDKYQQCITSGISNINDNHINRQLLFINGWWFFKHPKHTIDQFNELKKEILTNELIPTDNILNLVDKYTKQINGNTIGVHIRLTDSCSVLWETEENCDKLLKSFLDYLYKVMDDKNVNIFLCTDESYIIDNLKINYGNRIFTPNLNIDRFTKEGQEESYAEILSLSKCPKLILTMSSTFSGIVADLANLNSDNCKLISPSDIQKCNTTGFNLTV
jgi:hypothetical protein